MVRTGVMFTLAALLVAGGAWAQTADEDTGTVAAAGAWGPDGDGGDGSVGEGHVATNGGQHGDNGLPVIEIWKQRRLMELREGGEVLRQFGVAIGIDTYSFKRKQGDWRTPVGRYFVCEKHPSGNFHRFLGISYPNEVDAERGYAEGLIGPWEWAEIYIPSLRGRAPSWRTALGGRVGIHGEGGQYREGDWTHGCIAVTDSEIEYLYARVPVGATVIINE